MNENTPKHKLNQNYKENDKLKLNSISTPIEVNKYYHRLLIHQINDNQNRKYKTIAQSRQNNNNNNNISTNNDDSIPKPQNLFMNHYDALNKTTTDSHNLKNDIIDYKKKTNSIPKNRNNELMENNHDILFSKSTNNLSKMNTNNEKMENNNKNINLDENFGDDEDSENLSKLAEDLLSISDEYNIQMMRRGPIDKNDFIGESKVYYNINTQIEQSLTRTNMNSINLENLNQKMNPVPKLQSQLYISPLQKLNKKNINYMNKLINMRNKSNNNNINNEINNNLNNNMKNNINQNIYSNINNNINNQKNNNKNEVSNYNLNNSRGPDLRKYSKIKNHISSNSIVNNNTSAQISNYPILNHINDQININNINVNSNNNILKKSTNSQFNNSNIYDSMIGINKNMNNSIYNPDRFIEKINYNYTSNEHISNNNNGNSNNPNSNRNNNSHSIGKKINSINRGFYTFKKNIISYSGYNHKTNINNYNQILNSKIDNNLNDMNNNMDNINYINNNVFNSNQIKNANNTNTINNYNNINNVNYNNNINNIKNINQKSFKRLDEEKSLSKKKQINNPQQNRIIDNNRYGMDNIEKINKNINNMNYNLNNDIILYDTYNKGIPNSNNIKSASKKDRSHRKNIINIPQQNFLRTSDIQNYTDNIIYQRFNDPNSKISMNTTMQKQIERNSLQSKSHNKNQYNEIKNDVNMINNNNNTGNKGMNYINVNNIQNIPNNHFKNDDENFLLKTYQQKNIFSLKNSDLNNNKMEYLNKNIRVYQGTNDELNYLNNNNYMSNSPFEIPAF